MNRFQPFSKKGQLWKRKFFSVSVLSDLTLTPCRRAADFAADVDADVPTLQRPLRGVTGSTRAVVSCLKKAHPRPYYPIGLSTLGRARG